MTRAAGLSHHPSPAAGRVSRGRLAFVLYTGPLAWFVQLCAGEALTSQPCYRAAERLGVPVAGGTHGAALTLILICAALAALAGYSGLRLLREVDTEVGGDRTDLVEIGQGRTRFIALWAAILGFFAAVVTLATLVGFALVAPCRG
jgi:hypothetical protein